MDAGGHTLSILTVALNEARHIARLKLSIDRMAPVEGVRVQTVLVDGGSHDATLREAEKAGFDRVIQRPGASIPVCRNAGAAEAEGEWLAFVDADCEVLPDWLTAAAGVLNAHPAVIAGWPAAPPEPGTWVQRAWHLHWSCKMPRRGRSPEGAVVRQEAFRLVTTRNMVLTRTALEALGGFDEALATGEDTDLAFRAYRGGIPVLGLSGLRVVHHGEPATLRVFFRQQLWHANRSAYPRILGAKNRGTGANAPVFTILFLLGLLLLPAGCLLGAWRHSPFPALAGALPLALLIAGPALRTARRAGALKHAAPLSVLYAAFGLARTLDLLGLARSKTSWKSA